MKVSSSSSKSESKKYFGVLKSRVQVWLIRGDQIQKLLQWILFRACWLHPFGGGGGGCEVGRRDWGWSKFMQKGFSALRSSTLMRNAGLSRTPQSSPTTVIQSCEIQQFRIGSPLEYGWDALEYSQSPLASSSYGPSGWHIIAQILLHTFPFPSLWPYASPYSYISFFIIAFQTYIYMRPGNKIAILCLQ